MACTPSGGQAATTAAQRTAASKAPPGGVSSDTSPISYARRAEIRSAVPISAIRAASPYGIRCAMYTASYALIATTSGRPIPGVEVRVVDAQGGPLGAGLPGEVLVRGFNVMRGYFEDETATAEGWLRTGDVGVLDDAGNLRITDRLKDMYIVGGFNAYPAETEQLLALHPDVAETAVIGVPDARLGEVGKAYVVRRPGAVVTSDDLIAWSRREMANYKVPREVEFVESLPRNASGKVVKGELRGRTRPGPGTT